MDIIYNGNSVDALFAVYQLIKAETVYSLEDIVLHPVSANISTWPSVKGSIQENIVWIVGTGATSDILSFWTKYCPGAMIIENHPNAKKYFDCAPEKFVKYDTEVSVSYLMHHYLANSEEEDIEDTPPYVAFLDKITMWRGEITLEDRVLREAFHNHEIMCRSLTNKSELMALLDKFVIAFTCHRDEVLSTYYHVVVNRDMAMNKMIETIGKITTITDENVGKWKLPIVSNGFLIGDTTALLFRQRCPRASLKRRLSVPVPGPDFLPIFYLMTTKPISNSCLQYRSKI
jgi:hypothetical protein